MINPDDHPAKTAWQSAAEAAEYRKSRHPGKFTRYHLEEEIITGWLGELPAGAYVLDAPCGAGRLVKTITGMGFRYAGVDISEAMIGEARKEALDNPLVVRFDQADLEKLPFENNAFDCVVIWRLVHHLGTSQVREAILKEAARVSRDRVLISFHHAMSFTAVRKWAQRVFFGRKQHGRPITHWRLEKEASNSGLKVLETRSFGKFRSINWFACMTKATK